MHFVEPIVSIQCTVGRIPLDLQVKMSRVVLSAGVQMTLN